MSFAIRGFLLSASVFVLLYTLLSLGVAFTWRVLAGKASGSARRSASRFFALRMLPLLAAAAVTSVLMVPSFLLLEPRAVEPLGWLPRSLGCACILVLALGALHAARALVRSSSIVSGWMSGAKTLVRRGQVPVFSIAGRLPAFTMAGIWRSRVLVSEASAGLLSKQELEIALRHELAHARRRDNLKKLLLRFAAFPGMSSLERAWHDATEMAADDEAVSSQVEALDLALALIKLSRFSATCPAPELTTSLVRNPAASVDARVKHLIEWERPAHSGRSSLRRYLPTIATMAVMAISYTTLLSAMHEVTEWLVR